MTLSATNPNARTYLEFSEKTRIFAVELVLICTADNKGWWQRQTQAKTHISSLFDRLEPMKGDIFVEVIDDVLIGRTITSGKRILHLGKQFEMRGSNRMFSSWKMHK